MKRFFSVLVVLSFLLGTLSFAKGHSKRRGKRRSERRIEKRLEKAGVDQATRAKIKAIYIQARKDSRKIRMDIRQKRKQIRTLFRQDNLDESKINALAEEIGELAKQSIVQKTKTLVDVAKLLTPEQRKALKKNRRYGRRGKGRRRARRNRRKRRK